MTVASSAFMLFCTQRIDWHLAGRRNCQVLQRQDNSTYVFEETLHLWQDSISLWLSFAAMKKSLDPPWFLGILSDNWVMNERKKASMASSHWKRQRFHMEKRTRFRKQEGREGRGEQPFSRVLGVVFVVFLFGGEQSGWNDWARWRKEIFECVFLCDISKRLSWHF